MAAKFAKWLKKSFFASAELLHYGWGFLLAVGLAHHLIGELLNQFGPPVGKEGPNIPLILATVAADTLLSFLVTLFSLRRLSEAQNSMALSTPRHILKMHSRDLAAEWLRVAAGVVKGGIMSIIPGFLRMWRWSFVSPIVVLDQVYAKGQRNALNYSDELSKGLVRWLALIWFVSLGFEFGIMQMAEMNFDFDAANWAWQGLIDLVSLILLIFTNVLVYVMYLDQKGDLK